MGEGRGPSHRTNGEGSCRVASGTQALLVHLGEGEKEERSRGEEDGGRGSREEGGGGESRAGRARAAVRGQWVTHSVRRTLFPTPTSVHSFWHH